MTNSTNSINSIARRNRYLANIAKVVVTIAICLTWSAIPAAAQLAGQGSLQGTVTDSTGAVIPNATVTLTNTATNVRSVQQSSSAGFYNISPLVPGTYSVQVVAQGFKMLMQDNVVVNALQSRVFDPVLSVGSETQTINVTAAPPVLDTADAALGLTIENSTYSSLPIQMSGSTHRDPTAFGSLTPGAQGGTRLPVVGGTGDYLGQLYLDGMPATTVNMQGDNRVVSLSMSVEAVDQFQVLTSTPPAEYMGAGAMNFTMKSGGLKYHGQVSDFVRNTAFDTWGFTSKALTVVNAAGVKEQAPKPAEHQNELSATIGGRVPKTRNKLFFFFAYDRYYARTGANPALYSIPSKAMLTGDFTELNGNVGGGGRTGTGADNPPILFDPTSNSCPSTACTRQPLVGIKNGVATNNVIPAGMISPIAKAMASFMPDPSNPSSLYNNYLGGWPKGYDAHNYDWRVDYEMSSRQRISGIGVKGDDIYLNNFSNGMPLPYVSGTYAKIYPQNYILEHVFTINSSLVNQLKYSFTRFAQPQINATDGIKAYTPSAFGISNVPQGRAGTEFLGATFGTTSAFGTAYTAWTSNGAATSTQRVTPNTYAVLDNVQWVRGKHSFTFGFSYLWEQINTAAPDGFSAFLALNYNAYSTANYAYDAVHSTYTNALSTSSTGFSFASYMLGAVGGNASNATSAPSFGLYPLSETGGRYHPMSPYFSDTFKITPKLTVNWGLRWDYLPPFHEVKDRWTFLNPNLTNPLTGTQGLLQFAGNHGGYPVSCNCRTPVQTYWKNFGPRLGFAWSLNPKTVIRSGFAVVYSQAGGVGGRGGNATGTGQTGFNMSATGPTEVGSGASAGPSYWLNNSAAFTTLGLANTGIFGAGYTYPSAPTPGVAAQQLNTGFYLSGGKMVSASSVSYADPYFSGRAPEIILWNFGIERSLTPDLTLGVNYAANESHFIVNSGVTGSNARGLWSHQLNPKYLAVLGSVKDSTGTKPILNAAATTANAAIVSSYFPDAPTPAFFTAAAAVSSSATVTQMLEPFPQYSGVSDTYGNVGNFNYNSLQVVLNQRMHKGLAFNFNYTYAKNLGDDGTFRSGYDLPAGAISGGTKSYKQNRIDRSWTAISRPHIVHAYGVYELPFGKGKIGSDSMLVRTLAGGWQFSGIYSFQSGTPLSVTWTGSTGTTLPGQGQAMPDLDPAFSGSLHTTYKYGDGPNGYNTCNLGVAKLGVTCPAKIQYLDKNGFKEPTDISPFDTPSNKSLAQYLIGNAPRSLSYGVRNPSTWNVDASMRRTFPLIKEGLTFTFEADCLNVWNHITFGNPNAAWSNNSSTFGTISSASGNRDWQFAGHLNF
ncbi:MAG TPA: carboxypeptidase-like regulatory domain-containing protein [Terracidiphilus sp.]|nr:carboxypeptidase-like regulatory domain-containing protein [Terracidiphilus sp.]